jgi:hypothetical protein
MKFEDLVWHLDHAASGDRERAWIKRAAGEGPNGELIVYHDGNWMVYVRHPNREHGADGRETTAGASKRRAFAVFKAMTE